MINLCKLMVTGVLSLLLFANTFAQQQTNITVDLRQETGPVNPIWAWFGHDEPNYTYMKDGKKLLGELAALSPVPVHDRTHNLLSSAMVRRD